MASLIHKKYGSADNIAALEDSLGETKGDEGVGTGRLQSGPKYASDDECSSANSGSAASRTTGSPARGNALDNAQVSGVYALLHEIQELKDNQGQLEDSFENLKAFYQQNYTMIMEALQKEQNRCDLIEQQLSDLTELHQNEIGNFYKKLTRMEENIAHQSYFRAADIDEVLEACQKHLFKLEQEQQQQKVVQLESLRNTTARTLVGKLINVLLAVLAVLLLIVSTVANCVAPFVKTCRRMFSTLLFVALFFLWRHWDATLEYLHDYFPALSNPE